MQYALRTFVLSTLAILLLVDPARSADKKAFPAPAVDELIKGWQDVAWGTSLDEFKKKFPDAKKLESGRWVSGKGEEDFAGVKVTAEYAFNKKDQLNMIRFQPDDAGKKAMRKTFVEAGVLREGPKPSWQKDGLTFAVADVDGDQFAIAIHAKFADPKAKPKP